MQQELILLSPRDQLQSNRKAGGVGAARDRNRGRAGGIERQGVSQDQLAVDGSFDQRRGDRHRRHHENLRALEDAIDRLAEISERLACRGDGGCTWCWFLENPSEIEAMDEYIVEFEDKQRRFIVSAELHSKQRQAMKDREHDSDYCQRQTY